MPRPLKVYAWGGVRYDERNTNTHKQTREVMAARSVAEVVRASGIPRHWLTHSISETANPRDVEQAMSEPGVVFWRPYGFSGDEPYYRVEADS